MYLASCSLRQGKNHIINFKGREKVLFTESSIPPFHLAQYISLDDTTIYFFHFTTSEEKWADSEFMGSILVFPRSTHQNLVESHGLKRRVNIKLNRRETECVLLPAFNFSTRNACCSHRKVHFWSTPHKLSLIKKLTAGKVVAIIKQSEILGDVINHPDIYH